MPCVALPVGFFPTPPSLPAGVSIPTFTPPTISNTFCCSFQIPPFGPPTIPLPPFPPGLLAPVIALMAEIDLVMSTVFDAVAISCPTQ